jgi:hypothetical protein
MAGARYECIYKNFLRDIRQYYSEKFNTYVANIQFALQLTPRQRLEAFPFQILQFTMDTFEEGLIDSLRCHTSMDRRDYIKHVAFTLACFILPKQIMKNFYPAPQD